MYQCGCLQPILSQLIGSLEVSIDTKLQTSAMNIDNIYFSHYVSLTIMFMWYSIRFIYSRTLIFCLLHDLSVALLWDPCNRPTDAEALYVPSFQVHQRVCASDAMAVTVPVLIS
ncbi:unnamed protein product [Brassica oleracea var. botrytis]